MNVIYWLETRATSVSKPEHFNFIRSFWKLTCPVPSEAPSTTGAANPPHTAVEDPDFANQAHLPLDFNIH